MTSSQMKLIDGTGERCQIRPPAAIDKHKYPEDQARGQGELKGQTLLC